MRWKKLEGSALARLWRRVPPSWWDPRRWLAAARRNAMLKLLSLVAAFSLWLFVNAGAREAELGLRVPLELRDIPPQLMLISPRVDFVDVLVAGPRTILGRIDRERLVIPLDLAGVRPGPSVFRIGPDSIDLPRGVQIRRINPSQVTLELARVERKTVPVRLQREEQLADGLVVGAVKLAPRSVEVVGPASDLSSIQYVQTEPVEISAQEPGPQQFEASLESPGDYFSLSATRVAVEVRIEDQMITREYRARVEVKNASYPFSLKPSEVRLTLRGPKRVLRGLELENGAVYIDATDEEPGVYEEEPVVVLPRGVDVIRREPQRLQLRLWKSRARR